MNLILAKEARIITCLLFLTLTSCLKKTEAPTTLPIDQLNSIYQGDLHQAIQSLDDMLTSSNQNTLTRHYLSSRNAFKQLEPILAAVDKENYKTLNAPNILKIEEEDATDIKIKKPFGYQVIEETLYEEPLDTTTLFATVRATKNRLAFILQNNQLRLENRHVLWLIRDAIIRVATMGITGFDSPVLERSLPESQVVYERLEKILALYKSQFNTQELYESWQTELRASQTDLSGDFDSFDRYTFIKNHSQKQMALWMKTVKDWQVNYSFELAIRHDASSLFSNKTFNLNYFSDYQQDVYDSSKIEIGIQLFNDKKLSKDGTMSCATCHIKDKAFTDGLAHFPKQKRNTPTLLYAGLQKGFFYDKRAGSLEGQIVAVVNNENEFHSQLQDLEQVVLQNQDYKIAFDSLYDKKITDQNVRNAIANYVRSLTPFNSKFDRNINGSEGTLTKNEINGFNLFMGKAKCATCHFPPTFNGTVPPNFKESELELLGVPKTADSKEVDDDLGRYDVYQTEERKSFFKTPTVRNVSLTAPYMHNGVYHTLEEVVDFYDHGGGVGMGFDLPLQTLPADSLHLSESEKKDVVAFMKALEDQMQE